MEGERGGCQVDLEIFGMDVGGGDREKYVVALCIMLGGALGPNDCKNGLVSRFTLVDQ